MRAIRLHAPGDLRMHEEPIPEPGPGEALVRIGSVGVCASDVHWWRDGRIGETVLSEPLVLGHEASGTVESLGTEVEGLSVGRQVIIEPAKPCMQCEYCQSGHYNVCPSIRFFGTPPTDGCFRDYITWPAALLEPVPDSISMDEAAMLEPMAIGIYAVDLAEALGGHTAAILGAGAIGLSVLQALRVIGPARTLVIEPIEARRKLASKLGADVVCSPFEAQEVMEDFTERRGFDIVFECAGEPDALRMASRLARILGKVIVVGIPKEDEYTFEAGASRRKQLSAIFVRRSNQTTERAINLLEKGDIDVLSYVTHKFTLENASEALKLAESRSDGVLRAVVQCDND